MVSSLSVSAHETQSSGNNISSFFYIHSFDLLHSAIVDTKSNSCICGFLGMGLFFQRPDPAFVILAFPMCGDVVIRLEPFSALDAIVFTKGREILCGS